MVKKGPSSLYLSITGHFFSQKDHRRHYVTLTVHQMPTGDTATNVHQIVEEIFTEWGIPNSEISAVLTDNGSTAVAASKPHFSAVDEDSKEDDVESRIEDDEDGE